MNKESQFTNIMLLPQNDGNGSGSSYKLDFESLIELRALIKNYHTPAGDFTALNGINLNIDAGEFVSIIGKSGSGKSTLINLLTGIDRATAGEIIIAGTPIHTLSEGEMAKWRGKNVGIVFQFFQMMPTLSIIENVMLPMSFVNLYSRQERNEKAMHLLDLVGIVSLADKFPHQIAGGQLQRAAIARALANDPPIIASDEPTGNLDSQSAKAIMNLFEDLVDKGKTILMVTHDVDLATRANRIITISDGEIISHN